MSDVGTVEIIFFGILAIVIQLLTLFGLIHRLFVVPQKEFRASIYKDINMLKMEQAVNKEWRTAHDKQSDNAIKLLEGLDQKFDLLNDRQTRLEVELGHCDAIIKKD